MEKYAYMREYSQVDKDGNAAVIRTINKVGLHDDNVFIDAKDYESLDEVLKVISKNDGLIIRSLVDLGPDIKQMVKVIDYLDRKGVKLYSVNEPDLGRTKYLEVYVQIRAVLKCYQEKKRLEGYQKALRENKVGRKKKSDEADAAIKMFQSGMKIEDIVKYSGLSKSSVYRALNEYKRELKANIEERKNKIEQMKKDDKKSEKEDGNIKKKASS